MEEAEYKLIISLPALLFAVGPCIVLLVITVCKPKTSSQNNLGRFGYPVTRTNTVPGLSKTMNDNRTKTKSFKDINNADYNASFRQTLCCFLYLFLLLFGSVATLFFQLLLLKVSYMYNLRTQASSRLLFHAADISHSCEQNDAAKECFKYDAWNKINEGPIDCDSAAVQNGTTDVICYRIVFSMGLASDASYGGFQLPLVVLNAATSAVLLIAIVKLYLSVF